MLDLEVLRIALGEHAQQLALLPMSLAAKVIEALHAAGQPGRLGGGDARVGHHLAQHEHDALLVRQVEVVRDGGVRLGVGAVDLVGREVGEDDGRGVRAGQRAGGDGRGRRGGRRVKPPLEEVDVGAGAVVARFGGLVADLLRLRLALLAGQGQHELRVLAGGLGDALVGVDGDAGADGVGVVGVAEAPDRLDFLGRERERLLQVDEGAEGLDAGLGGFVGGLGRLLGFAGGRRRRGGVGGRRRGRSWRDGSAGFATEVIDLVFVGVFQGVDVLVTFSVRLLV